jgi:hypothetical protein
MKVELGKSYRYKDRRGFYTEGQWKCTRIYRNMANLSQDSLTIIDVPCSLIFIKPTSQVFINYRNK